MDLNPRHYKVNTSTKGALVHYTIICQSCFIGNMDRVDHSQLVTVTALQSLSLHCMYTKSLVNATFGSGKKLCLPSFVLTKLSGISSYKIK